jgi:hypothetical protein
MCSQLFQSRKDDLVTLSDLVQLFKRRHLPTQTLYALLFWGALDFDLMQPLDQYTQIVLPSPTPKAADRRAY